MLYNIPAIIPPELLKILAEMGHGAPIGIGDGTVPATANAKRLVRCDGHGVPEVLDAILTLMPLDTYVESPARLMALTPSDAAKGDPPIWNEYRRIIDSHQADVKLSQLERFDFYAKTREAFAVVATGETALYANIILQKGVVV